MGKNSSKDKISHYQCPRRWKTHLNLDHRMILPGEKENYPKIFRTWMKTMRKRTAFISITILTIILLSSCSLRSTKNDPGPGNSDGEGQSPIIGVTIEGVASFTPEPTQPPAQLPTNTLVPSNPTATLTATIFPTVEGTNTPTLPPTEEPTLGSTRISDADGMEQIYIPAGEFTIGSEDKDAIRPPGGGRAYPEVPEHTLYLDSYWMDKYEVTNAQYAICVAAGGCQPPFFPTSFTIRDYYGNPEYDQYPVVYVDWGMARRYCEWAGRRLPTEAEWEKAARGTDGRIYPWGNDPIDGDKANWCDINCPRDFANGAYDDGYEDTSPVGNFPDGASAYGVMDMAGNVWEWTGTLIQPYPYDPNDGREDLDADGERAWRGAAFSNGYWWMRATVRYRSVTYYRYWNLGFRCASSY